LNITNVFSFLKFTETYDYYIQKNHHFLFFFCVPATEFSFGGVGISVSENLSIVIIDWTELTQLARPILAPVQ